MNVKKKPEKVKVRPGEAELQVSLMQAVAFGHLQAVEQAGKAINEHFVKYITINRTARNRKGQKTPRTTGPQMLDFVVTKDFKVTDTKLNRILLFFSILCLLHCNGRTVSNSRNP